MHIRPGERGEAAAIAAVHRLAFESDVEVDLAEALVEDEAYVSAYSLVAEESGRLVASVVVTRGRFVPDDGGPEAPVLVLAPLAVVPEAQRAGLGTAIVEASIVAARNAGEVALFVFGDPDYYGRFGFVAAMPKGIRGPHPLEPDWGWQVLELVPDALGASAGYVSVAQPMDAPELWRA
jgi:putative acetyltransferase